jgi:hypothetical protein
MPSARVKPVVSTRRSPIDNRYQWKFGRPAGCIRVYTANATPTQITTRRMVSHVDRVIRSSCLARTCSMSAVGLQASHAALRHHGRTASSTALANILLHNVLVCIRYRKASAEEAAYGERN